MSVYLSGSYEELAAQAQQHMRRREYGQAQEIFERIYNRLSKMKSQVIDRRPHLKELQLLSIRMLGDLTGLQRAHDEAIAYYEAALEIDPEEGASYRRAIAQIKIDKGDVAAGLDELRALAVLNAGEAQPWLWLGLELWGQGNHADAIKNLERAANMTGADAETRSHAYTYLHDVYREANRLDEAEAAWQQAWRVTGQRVGDVSPLYQMYWEAGDLEKGRFWLDQEKNPLRSGFYRGLFAQSEGLDRRANSAWRKVVNLDPLAHEEGHEAWAEAALRVNAPPASISYVMREISGRGEVNIRGAILLAVAEVREGQIAAAETALEAAVDVNRRARPPKEYLSADQWELFEELVSEAEAKEKLKKYFEVP